MAYQATVTEVRNTQDNHYKFYRAYIIYDKDTDDYRVLFNWGRIGAQGRYQPHRAPSLVAAQQLATKKIAEKTGHGYELSDQRTLIVVPEDLLAHALVEQDDNARRQQQERVAVDAHARFAADADTLIRMVSYGVSGEAIALRSSLEEQLGELRNRLVAAEGQMELINDVMAMKVNA